MSKFKAPVKKNETITTTIVDLTHEGNGVAKIDGYPLFIPEALPGEKAEVLVVKVNKRFGYGKLLKLLLFPLVELRSEEHTSELQSRFDLVCRLLLEKKKNNLRHTSK